MNFDCDIKDGKLQSNSESIRKWVQTQKDGEYILEIRKVRNKPNQTMRYYYKILSILAKGLGYHPEDLKEMVKMKLNHYEHIKDPEGNDRVKFWSTSDYTPEMYNDAIQLVMYWGGLNDIYIMSSEEYKLQFES